METESGSATDIGRVRKHNEDAILTLAPLYVVADGMGGHEAGEVAAQIAVETIAAHLPRYSSSQALGRAIKAANREVFRGVSDGRGRPGMGATVTAAVVQGSSIAIGQVGDSRAYLLHHGRLQRITRDHSLVADLVAEGRITEVEARYHPNRSVVTRALGSDPDMEPDLYEVDAAPGDRLLICSDGLNSMIEDDLIERILIEFADPQIAADKLIEAANRAGGHDNISAIVVDITSPEAGFEKRRVRRQRVSALLWTLAVATLLIGSVAAIVTYARSVSFLIEEDGHVSLYRGIPGSLAGLSLEWPISVDTTIPVSALPTSVQYKLVDGLRQPSVEAGENILEVYRDYADAAALRELGSREATATDGAVEVVPEGGPDANP